MTNRNLKTEALVTMKQYLYLLTLWANNLSGDDVEYYALEALLMAIAEQQDQFNTIMLNEQLTHDDDIVDLLSQIDTLLNANRLSTEAYLASGAKPSALNIGYDSSPSTLQE